MLGWQHLKQNSTPHNLPIPAEIIFWFNYFSVNFTKGKNK